MNIFDPKRWKRVHWSDFLSALLWLGIGLIGTILLLRHLNAIQIDHAGHLSSAMTFLRGSYHSFHDSIFLGYVHGLFYPPLEDAILAIFLKVGQWTGIDPLVIYRIYLAALWATGLVILWKLSSQLTSRSVRIWFRFILAFLLMVNKPGLNPYQGLSLIDLTVTGLSSEHLGGIFLFLLMLEQRSKNRTQHLVLWASLAFLSHIIVGAFAVALLMSFRKMLMTAAITAFYWVPFIMSKGYLTSSTLTSFPPFAFAVLVLALVRYWKQDPSLWVVAGAFVLHVIASIAQSLGASVPAFHYYRLAMPALFIFFTAIAFIADRQQKQSQSQRTLWKQWVIPVLASVTVGILFRPMRIDFRSQDYKPTEFSVSNNTPDRPFVRNLVFGDSRSADFGIESMIQVYDENQFSVKGLYWESARANRLLSSYLATLLEPPVVLDYFYYFGQPCAIQSCILDHFIQDYQIGKVTLDQWTSFLYLRPEKNQCYQKILRDNGTENFVWSRRAEEIQVSGRPFWTYDVEATDLARKNGLSSDLIQMINPVNVKYLIGKESQFHQEALQTIFKTCQKGEAPNLTFIPSMQLKGPNTPSFPEPALPAPPVDAQIHWDRVRSGDYQIHINSPTPVAFKIKLHYYPGLKLFDEQNQEVPLIQGYPHLIAVAKGHLHLKYEKPWYFWLGYFLSTMAVVICVAAQSRKRTF